MPYDPIVFVDEEEGVSGTDLNAAAFNHMEDGIVAATDLGENAATAAVVAALEARVEALETAPPPETEKVGAIKLWTQDAAPDGYLICDGSAVSRSTYAALFDEIGETFGDGNGSTTFNLPDLRGNVPVGRKSGDADFGTLGAAVGAKRQGLPTEQWERTNWSPGAVNYSDGGLRRMPTFHGTVIDGFNVFNDPKVGDQLSGATIVTSEASDPGAGARRNPGVAYTSRTTPGGGAGGDVTWSKVYEQNVLQPSLVLNFIIKT